MGSFGGDGNILSSLENAAQVFMSPPGKVKDDDRKNAEKIFLELRNTKSPFQLCQSVLESTQNEVVIFQAAAAIKESTLREWSILDQKTIVSLWKYLLVYITRRPNLSGYATAEILQAVAMILKRGTFDNKCGSSDQLFSSVFELISSGEINLQSLACQILLSVCTEYCTSWRSSTVGITWDFHIRAKRVFESTSLKRVLQLALEVLDRLLASSDSLLTREGIVLCNRLLCVVEAVVSWHFGSRMLPKRLTFALEFAPAISLRPPEAWKDVYLDQNVLSFFFQLHSRVRQNQELAHHSLQCLIQLGSLTGAIFSTEEDTDQYLRFFVRKILDLYQEIGPLEHEILNVCTMIQRFITYHPLPSLMRLPQELLSPFITLLTGIAVQLCPKAIQEIFSSSDEKLFSESLTKILDAWAVLLKAEARIQGDPNMFSLSATEIYKSFLSSVISAPHGTRNPAYTDDAEVNEDVEEDDRVEYGDMLGDIGIIGRHCLPFGVPKLAGLLEEKLTQFGGFLSSGNEPDKFKFLPMWQEDMHWILMIIGFSITGEECDKSCFVHHETIDYIKTFQYSDAALNEGRNYLRSCLLDPNNVSSSANLDPVLRIIGGVLLWSNLEVNLLRNGHFQILSPQLAQTTLWCLKRLILAYQSRAEDDESGERSSSPHLAKSLTVKVVLRRESELSQGVVDFLVHKIFLTLGKWSGEGSVTADAVLVLETLAELRATEICGSSTILEEVKNVQLEQLMPAAKRGLLRGLVLIGASTEDNTLQEKLYLMILDPLAKRFECLVASRALSAAEESSLLDILDCFAGVAEAAQTHSAEFLFKFLCPVLVTCVPLLNTCKDRQTIVEGVLGLFKAVTKQMGIYLEKKNDSMQLYNVLLELLKTYAANQAGKYALNNMEEDQAGDLVLVMEILANILSKDLLLFSNSDEDGDGVNSAAKVALMGLEIVIPLMSKELLRFPALANKYYQLILFVTEMFPEDICQQPPHMLNHLFNSITLAFTSDFGNEVMKSGLELVNVLATFTCQSEIGAAQEIKTSLKIFLKPVFQMCLSTSCEVDVFSDASLALYALICCDQISYNHMVQEILSSHEDDMVRQKLTAAFLELLPAGIPAQPLRKEKRSFRDRLEKFMDNIQGLLLMS